MLLVTMHGTPAAHPRHPLLRDRQTELGEQEDMVAGRLRWALLWLVSACHAESVRSGQLAPPPPNATANLSPMPQVVQHDPSVAPFLLDYNAYITVDTSNSSHLFAANDLQAQVFNSTGLRLPVVPLKAAFSPGY